MPRVPEKIAFVLPEKQCSNVRNMSIGCAISFRNSEFSAMMMILGIWLEFKCWMLLENIRVCTVDYIPSQRCQNENCPDVCECPCYVEVGEKLYDEDHALQNDLQNLYTSVNLNEVAIFLFQVFEYRSYSIISKWLKAVFFLLQIMAHRAVSTL